MTSSNPGDVAADVREARKRVLATYRCTGCGGSMHYDPGVALGKLKHWLRQDALCGILVDVERAPKVLREHWSEIDRAGRQ